MKLGSVVYSIHKSATRDFISGWLRRRNTLPEMVIATKLEIPHQFGFHRKKKANVDVDVSELTKSVTLLSLALYTGLQSIVFESAIIGKTYRG